MKYLVSFFLILFFAVCAAAQGTYEQYMSSGMSNLERKDYDASEQAFRAALRDKPDDYKATLYLGIVLSRKGSKEGESLLKKALMMDPRDPEVNLQLGIYYYNKAVYPEARDYFETTIEISPGTRYASISNDYMARIDRAGPKPWRLDISAGMQYDSNVILGPDNFTPVPGGISRKDDWRGVFYLKGQYDLVSTDAFRSTASYSIYQSLHFKLDDFNLTQQVASLDAAYSFSKAVVLRGAYSFEHVLVGGDKYDYAHVVGPSLILNEGIGFTTNIYYDYRWTHFYNGDLFENNSDRTGSNNLVGITQFFSSGDLFQARVGYAFDRDSTRKDYWDYDGNKGFAGFTLKPGSGLSIDLYGEYYDKNYKGIFPSAVSGAPDAERHDKVQTYAITLAQQISKTFTVTVSEMYVRNQSNIETFDYKRSITSLFLTARF